MRRLLNAASIVSLILLLATLAAWGGSYFTDVHVGKVRGVVDPYGTSREYREGVFISDGCVCWASGTIVRWQGGGVPPQVGVVGERSGVFLGGFRSWTSLGGRTAFGFGYWREADHPQSAFPNSSDIDAISTPVAAWAVMFAVLPWWWWQTRRRGWTTLQFHAGVMSSYLVLVTFTFIAIAMPVLALLVVVYFVIRGLIAGINFIQSRLAARRRGRDGLCRKCGYDLRATPDPDGPLLDRCPECGTYTAGLRTQ